MIEQLIVMEAEKQRTAVGILEGALLRSTCGFPYLFLVAFEAGSIFRALILLLAYPLVLLWSFFSDPSAALVSSSSCSSSRLLIFIAVCGLKQSAVESAARAVLPKFYVEDLRWETYEEFVRCDRRLVVALKSPRLMIEPFLREYLRVDYVAGLEIHTTRSGYCTGLVKDTPDTDAYKTLQMLVPDVGIGTYEDYDRLRHCKQTYLVHACAQSPPVPRSRYLKPLVFHDGRIAVRPTPTMALTIFLWLPIGIWLAIPRALILVLCPSIPLIIACEAVLGVTMRYKGDPPLAEQNPGAQAEYPPGNLFVCSHRTLLDPVVLSGMIFRRVTAVTYSISWLTELLSPIRTVRLTRSRNQDATTISSHLSKGDLIVCPEGTTCREPYLLRFSKLFVEIAETVVPVAMSSEIQLFHGTSVRGWKAFDPFFFALNPKPRYDVEFLERINLRELAASGMSSFHIANIIQQRIAKALGFECTGLTRRDKYRMLAGNEGLIKT